MPSRTTRPWRISPRMGLGGSWMRRRAWVTRWTPARPLLPDLQEVGCGFVGEPQCRAVAQLAARIEPHIEEVPRHDVAGGLQHRLLATGMFLLEVEDQPLDPGPLEAEIAARGKAAADDPQSALLGGQARFGLLDVHERPDDDVLAVVGPEPRRHRLERAREEQVQQQRLDEVVEMMAERDLGRADLRGDSVEHSAAQPRAERARRGVRLEQVVHHLANRRVLDAVFPPALAARLRDDVVLELLVAGIDVDRDQREVDRRALPELVEDLQERPAVLATRQADHDAVAVFNEVEVLDRFRGLLCDACFEGTAVSHRCLEYSARLCNHEGRERYGPACRTSAMS